MGNKALWKRPAPVGQGTQSVAVMEVEPAAGVAEESHQQMVDRGWCAWKCEGLGGDTIIVVIDEDVKGYPAGYPVYTLQELRDILGRDDRMLQAAHKAKKELGAKIE